MLSRRYQTAKGIILEDFRSMRQFQHALINDKSSPLRTNGPTVIIEMFRYTKKLPVLYEVLMRYGSSSSGGTCWLVPLQRNFLTTMCALLHPLSTIPLLLPPSPIPAMKHHLTPLSPSKIYLLASWQCVCTFKDKIIPFLKLASSTKIFVVYRNYFCMFWLSPIFDHILLF